MIAESPGWTHVRAIPKFADGTRFDGEFPTSHLAEVARARAARTQFHPRR